MPVLASSGVPGGILRLSTSRHARWAQPAAREHQRGAEAVWDFARDHGPYCQACPVERPRRHPRLGCEDGITANLTADFTP